LKPELENFAEKKLPQKNGPPVFAIRESHICSELGMSENEVRRRRVCFLQQGTDWEVVKKRVLYSELGAQVLRDTRDTPLPAVEQKDAAGTDSEPKKLIAWGAPGHNPHVLVCYVPGTDPHNPLNLVTLRVRDNRNFMRGMKIPGDGPPGNRVKVTPVRDRENVFDLQGPLPRWKGRW
jgi:hypothetical protein